MKSSDEHDSNKTTPPPAGILRRPCMFCGFLLTSAAGTATGECLGWSQYGRGEPNLASISDVSSFEKKKSYKQNSCFQLTQPVFLAIESG